MEGCTHPSQKTTTLGELHLSQIISYLQGDDTPLPPSPAAAAKTAAAASASLTGAVKSQQGGSAKAQPLKQQQRQQRATVPQGVTWASLSLDDAVLLLQLPRVVRTLSQRGPAQMQLSNGHSLGLNGFEHCLPSCFYMC